MLHLDELYTSLLLGLTVHLAAFSRVLSRIEGLLALQGKETTGFAVAQNVVEDDGAEPYNLLLYRRWPQA